MRQFTFEDVVKRFEERLTAIEDKLERMQAQQPGKKWLTNEEARAYLEVSPRTLQNYRDKGMIRFSQVGAKIYYKVDDLDNFLFSHMQGGFRA